jgi:N-acetylmuramic acid 6-phosphate etherase
VLVKEIKFITETQNSKTIDIDLKSPLEIVKIMNDEDKLVSQAVERELDKIAMAVELIVKAFTNEGRLVYIGAGTSGRLGILDASECLPTFGIDYGMVIGLIAGGEKALVNAVEGAEDDYEQGEKDIEALHISQKDVVVGVTASGRTPYVIGGIKKAREAGAATISISCNEAGELEKITDVSITPIVGPEVITGSTRLKAGTAQKMVLNMLSTASMISIGKTYCNLMVDVQATNKKLYERAKRIIMTVTDASEEATEKILRETNNNVKLSIFMLLSNLQKESAEYILNENKGFIRKALNSIKN